MGVLNTWGMGLFSLIAQKHLLVLKPSWMKSQLGGLGAGIIPMLAASNFIQTRWADFLLSSNQVNPMTIPWTTHHYPNETPWKHHKSASHHHILPYFTIFYHICPYFYPFFVAMSSWPPAASIPGASPQGVGVAGAPRGGSSATPRASSAHLGGTTFNH